MNGQDSSGTQTSDETGETGNTGNTGRRLSTIQGVILSICTAAGALGALWAAYETMQNNNREGKEESHIEITSPTPGRENCYEVGADRKLSLEGEGKMAEGVELWGVTKADTFYVSNVSKPRSPDGDWTMAINGVGRPGDSDVGKKFTLYLIGASANVSKKFQDTLYIGIPALARLPADGVDILKRVCMRRVS